MAKRTPPGSDRVKELIPTEVDLLILFFSLKNDKNTNKTDLNKNGNMQFVYKISYARAK